MNALDPTLVLIICIGPIAVLLVTGIFLIEKLTVKKIKPKTMSPDAMRYYQRVCSLSIEDMKNYVEQLDPDDQQDREALAALGGKQMFEAIAGHIYMKTAVRLREEREKEHGRN